MGVHPLTLLALAYAGNGKGDRDQLLATVGKELGELLSP